MEKNVMTSSSLTSLISTACPKLSRRQQELLSFHLSGLKEETNPRTAYIVDDLKLNFAEIELLSKLSTEWMQTISFDEGQNIVFCNRFKVSRRLKKQQALFMDIGRHGTEDHVANVLPYNHQHRATQIQMAQKIIESDECISYLNKSDCSDLDVPSIFGLLLGFPVVYCNASDKEYKQTCFDHHGVELALTIVKDGEKELLSFSYPVGLELDKTVDKWIDMFVQGKRFSTQRKTLFQQQFVL